MCAQNSPSPVCPNFRHIAESGQCFRWKKISENKYSVVAMDRYVEFENKADGTIGYSCSEQEWNELWKHYLDEDDDYNHIRDLIYSFGDSHLIESFENGCGMRILNQDLWEMIVSFLISQNNNITRIKNSIEKICVKAKLPTLNRADAYRFPKWNEIEPEFFDDTSLGLGYRVDYLKEIYSFAKANPNWFDYLKTLNYEEAREELLKRKGIGPKVADCICLFGLHHIDAFPIDTHVKQLLNKYYPDGFNYEYFKGYAGVIQQYLFYFEIK